MSSRERETNIDGTREESRGEEVVVVSAWKCSVRVRLCDLVPSREPAAVGRECALAW